MHLSGKAVFKLYQQYLRNENHCRCEHGAFDVSCAAYKTDYRRGPQSGRGREPLDALALGHNDRARADEAYACDDLCAESSHIGE